MRMNQMLRNNRALISHKEQILQMTVPALYIKTAMAKFCAKSVYSDELADFKVKEFCGYTNKEDPPMGILLCNDNDNSVVDLSLIVPVYNAKKYIQRCLDSIIRQKTNYNFEVIVINDGFTDGTEDILLAYENYHNVKIYNQANQGISATRNKGVEYARGVYIGFIDNDDYIVEDYVEKLLDKAYKNNADYVKCGYCKFDKDGILTTNIVKSRVGNPLLMYDGFIWGGIVRKSIFNRVSFPSGYWYEDVITKFIIMRMANVFCYVDEPLYMYYVHPSNASVTIWRSNNKKCTDQYFLVDFLCRYSIKLGLKNNDHFKGLLMHELGEMLWERTKAVPDQAREAVFIKACKLVNMYVDAAYRPQKLDDKLLLESFRKKNYKEWKAVSHLRKNKG